MKTLYFIQGQPTDQDREKAALAGAVFRNAAAWHEGDFIERCDAVMGEYAIIPAPYRDKIAKTEMPPLEPKPKRRRKAATPDG